MHLETCRDCVAIHADLQEVNRQVGTIGASVALVVSLLGLVGGGAASAWAWLSAHVEAVGKAVVALVTPPATVAVVTAAAVVGVAGTADVVDPPRHPMTLQADAPQANRARVAIGTEPSRVRTTPSRPVDATAATPAKPAPSVAPAPTQVQGTSQGTRGIQLGIELGDQCRHADEDQHPRRGVSLFGATERQRPRYCERHSRDPVTFGRFGALPRHNQLKVKRLE